MDNYLSTFISSYFLILILVSAGFALLAGWLAAQRGRSAGKFFALSFFCSFLIAVIVLIALPNLKSQVAVAQASDAGHEKCPFCAEMIKSEATICKFCQGAVAEHFAAKREASAKAAKLEEQERNKLEKQRQLEESRIAAERAELDEQAREWTRALIRSPKFLVTTAVGLVVVILIGIAVGIMQANADAQKKAVANRNAAKATAVALVKYEDFMKHSNWTATLKSCKEHNSSPDLISASGSAPGDFVKVVFRLSDPDSVDPSPSLQAFFNCFGYYFPHADTTDPFHQRLPMPIPMAPEVSWHPNGLRSASLLDR